MPMKMGIHRSLSISRLASLDSRIRGNDGDVFFPRKHLQRFSSA